MTIVDRLLGGLVIEIFIAQILYGISTAQTYVYMLNSKNDAKLLKLMVYTVWVLETAHTVFISHLIYHYVITSFGNLPNVNFIVWSTGAAWISELLIIVLVQCFYLRRVWILSERSYALTLFPTLLLIARFVFGAGTSVLLYMVPTWSEFHEKPGPMATISGGLSFSVAVDFVIAAILFFYLRRGQSESSYTKSSGVIRICMVYAVNTGALTMIVSILILVTFLLMKNSLAFAGLASVASKLYANSFLGTLNARHFLRRKTEESRWQLDHCSKQQPTLRQIEIYQQTTMTVEHDSGRKMVTYNNSPLAEIYKASDLTASREGTTLPAEEHGLQYVVAI